MDEQIYTDRSKTNIGTCYVTTHVVYSIEFYIKTKLPDNNNLYCRTSFIKLLKSRQNLSKNHTH